MDFLLEKKRMLKWSKVDSSITHEEGNWMNQFTQLCKNNKIDFKTLIFRIDAFVYQYKRLNIQCQLFCNV